MYDKFVLNRDWKKFEPALKAELQKLNATEDEIEQITEGAWQAATEIDSVENFAKEELDLLREENKIKEDE